MEENLCSFYDNLGELVRLHLGSGKDEGAWVWLLSFHLRGSAVHSSLFTSQLQNLLLIQYHSRYEELCISLLQDEYSCIAVLREEAGSCES